MTTHTHAHLEGVYMMISSDYLLFSFTQMRDKLPHLKAIVQYKGEVAKDYPDVYNVHW